MKTLAHIACAIAVVLSASAPAATRRFALVAGNDQGGDGTRRLEYATDDAKKIHDILVRLGGVKEDDAVLLLDGDADELIARLGELSKKAEAAKAKGEETALVVYYSGHAKDGALRMGDTRLPFDAVKAKLSKSAADVRIGIFDSCRSGTLTRTKGARKAPAFEVASDSSQAAKGMVLLTSSSADEDSQESDGIGGSYFSHHLASGLLGDADRSADGRVTLSEAYEYAYDRTVADTAETAAGAQHPTYSYDLAGNGDVVLTDVLERKEGVVFPANAASGTWYVVDGEGTIAAEVRKGEGEEKRLALAPGGYTLKRRLDDRLRVGELTVSAGRVSLVDEAKLRDAPFSDDPVKGDARYLPKWSLFLSGGYQSFLDAPTRSSLFPAVGMVAAEAQLKNYFRRDFTLGFDVATGNARSRLLLDGLPPLDYQFRALNFGASLLREFDYGRVRPFVGGRVALLLMSRDFDDALFPSQSFGTFSPGFVFGLKFNLTSSFSAAARGRFHYVLYNVDESRSLAFFEAAILLGYSL